MFLKEIRITNFRSLQNQTLSFTDTNRCRILVGVNESGKSNVLRALSMLSPDVQPLKEDVREPSPQEGAIKESFVRFVFDLDTEEISRIYQQVAAKMLTKSKDPDLVDLNGRTQTLDQFCKAHGIGLYRVNLLKGTKEAVYFTLGKGYLLRSRWKKVSSSVASSEKQLTLSDGREVDLDEYLLVDVESYPEISNEVLEDADANYVYGAIGAEISKVIKEGMPSCVYWTYSERNLLPSRINLPLFIQDPDTCLPLKNMFLLAGVDKIADAISQAQEKSTHGLRNLFSLVATTATRHIHAIWKEYKDIEIRLEPYGPTEIDAGVKDAHNLYEMSRRSDGFKRFVSFLLLVSAKVRTKQLVNTVLLIDEPDSGLHPSGARYLKDELITIAGANYVVFSTHSIFMIDKGQIDRHLIVKKEKEVTRLLEANESNFVDEEVLYNALGYSIFEILAEQNLLFEGWRDKRLFDIALARVPGKHKSIKDSFKSIGRCHAQGVKDIKYIAPLLELANRGCLIISDDDEIAREKQREYQRQKGYGRWLRYSEILTATNAISGEDFVTVEAVKEAWKELKKKNSELPDLTDDDLKYPKGKIQGLNSLLGKAGLGSEAKKIVEDFKDELFGNLKATHIEESYYDFLQALTDVLDDTRESAKGQ